jgi:arsenate reductase (thioredoxin)
MQQYKILFLCTGNSARSIIAEQLIQRISKGRFQAFSAGSKPTGKVHPMALRVLKETYHIDTIDAHSKSLDEFIQAGMVFDFVITLCDNAKETCPVFPGQPITAHWGSPDPAAFEGDEAATFACFVKVAMQIQRRIELFCALPFVKIDRLRLQQMTTGIGQK